MKKDSLISTQIYKLGFWIGQQSSDRDKSSGKLKAIQDTWNIIYAIFWKRKMEIFCQKIKLFTGIKLKSRPYKLIHKTKLNQWLRSKNRRESAIVITVENSKKTSRLYFKKLRFERAIKVAKKYWKARSASVCMGCKKIIQDCLRNCAKRAMQYVICARLHKVQIHKYRVIRYNTKMMKIYTNITLKCTNCGGN